ncbi:TadE/TadG family type IV pilus assembly protein [Nitrosomonas sp. Nm58]|uniref:TadE/TadG family type IV pilus assembly protein n=1 Tax=Nitrosomonas sp. Nm58 TaxID=200126 RepID=UPI00089D6DC4|nr:TadE family protein [Nitrosomonas sp. Nm58]SDY66764.1 TadE-like protein [Nitrosomonas sp. Nm58]
MRPQHYKLPKSMRGAVAVEFALLLIPMLMLALGAAEFGRALYQYNTLVKATRDAVRHLSQRNPTETGYSQAQTEAQCLAVHGNTGCTGQPLAPGLTTGLVSIKHYANVATGTSLVPGPPINLVEVGITGYTFNFILDPRAFLGGGESSLTFGDIRATMRQS